MPNRYISVVSPVYKAEAIVSLLVNKVEEVLKQISPDYEIILVDDGSPDNSWNEIRKICASNDKVKGIKLSRNFGQHYAITAGLDNTLGAWVVVMDCDLQDLPSEIIKLHSKAKEGYDIVMGQRLERSDKFFKRTFSRLFYFFFSYLTDLKQDGTVANFGIYSRKAVDAVSSMREPFRAFSPMIRWVGFAKTYLPVNHGERYSGQSTYNFNSLIRLAMGIIFSYSDKPLRITIKLGFIVSLSSLFVGLFYVYKYLTGAVSVVGYSSLIISIWFIGGLIIFFMGVVGLYIGKIFEAVRNRPIYLIDQIINDGK